MELDPIYWLLAVDFYVYVYYIILSFTSAPDKRLKQVRLNFGQL